MADSITAPNQGSAIGYVKLITGQVTAVDSSGIERVLQLGDTVYADDVVVTSSHAGVVIELRDGTNLSMGGGSETLLNDEVYDPAVAQEISDRATTIDAIQQAILAGADPTQVLDATAAGAGEATGDGNQGQVSVERTGAETTPESGFETSGLNQGGQDSPTDQGAGVATTGSTTSGSPVDTAPTISVTAVDFTEGDEVAAGDTAGNYVTSDAEGDAVTVSFTPGTNINGHYALVGGQVVLTPAGVNQVNEGGALDPIDLTVTQDSDPTLFGTGSDTPVVTPVNDAPDAVNDAASGNEGSTITVLTGGATSVLANDTDAEGNPLTVTSFTQPANGTVTVNSDGTFSYTHDGSETTSDSFTYTISDGQGGTDTATVNLTIVAVNDAPVPSPSAVVLSEEGLSGANADSSGSTDTTDQRIVSGNVTITDADSSNFTVTLNAPVDTLSSNGKSIVWAGDDTSVLIGTADGNEVIRIVIDNLGAYTVTLSGPLDHALTGVEDVLDFDVTVKVTDDQGAAGTTTLNVTVEDDSPIFDGPTTDTAVPVSVGETATGDLGVNLGADDGSLARIDISGVSVDGDGYITATHVGENGTPVTTYLTYQGMKLSYQDGATPGSLVAVATDDTEVFSVVPDVATGQYEVTMLATLDLTSYTATTFGSLTAGNTPNVYLWSDSNNIFSVEVEGTASGLASTVNTNNGYFGVANNWINDDEQLSLTFDNTMTAISFNVDGLSSGETVIWRAFDSDGTEIGSGTLDGAGAGNTDIPLNISSSDLTGGEFSRLEFEAAAGSSYRIGPSSITGETALIEQTIQLGVTGIDVDGDPTATTQTFDILLSTTGLPLGQDELVTTAEDVPYTFSLANFQMHDQEDGDPADPTDVRIDSLPAQGELTLDGVAVSIGQVISAADISSGFLLFTPDADGNGSNYAQYDFSVRDSSGLYDPVPNTVTVSVTPVNDAPQVGSATIHLSEEGLTGGVADTLGTSDTTDDTVFSGQLAIDDVDGDVLSVTLTAPVATLYSNGVALSWAGDGSAANPLIGTANGSEVLRATVDSAGNYTVTLSGPLDHSGTGVEDTLTIGIGVQVSDGNLTSSNTLTVVVEDDSPMVCDAITNIPVGVDSITIQNLAVGWVDPVFLNGTNQVTQTDNDGDPLIDQITWGTPGSGSGQSGYTLVDNVDFTGSTGSAIQAGNSFKIADFSHLNWPIYSNSSILQQVTLTLSMDVVINGYVSPVQFDVLVDHNETDNGGADPRDIITLPSQAVTVTIGGQEYEVSLDGFRDSNGDIVSTIYTDENSTNPFEIMGSIVSTDPLPTASGNVCDQVGADGSVAGVVWGDTTSDYGTLTVNSDGSYTFVVDRDVKDTLLEGQTLNETFDYTITDQDGDSSAGTLTINIGGYNSVDGTDANDILVGTNLDDYIDGNAGADAISAGAGDDVLVYDSADTLIDGGVGTDTLLIPDNDGLDFSAVSSGTLQNIEQIDLTSGSHTLSNLDVADVLDINGGNNLLEILGGDTDSVSLSSDWQATGNIVTQDGHMFAEYKDAGDTVTLLIEDHVNVII
ncbi:retention module-containing protein [Sedimenticola sp.]|uniref:retention module-containing protein n=1 Tax=Sedimenticola sp. TaxID=1940285 RepID=UPI003D0C41EB